MGFYARKKRKTAPTIMWMGKIKIQTEGLT